MKRVLWLLGALAVAAFAANSLQLDHPLPIPHTDDQLTYDDGTSHWLTWGGLYRGTWFNLGDFGAGPTWAADDTEFWFYHHASRPWDTSSFYAEVYSGDFNGPVTQLDQTMVTAAHYTDVYAEYTPALVCPYQFWVIINSEMSGGGWPSILGDNTPPAVGNDHSFFSDDFVVWEPWAAAGDPEGPGDYFIRTNGESALNNSTWGTIKALYN